MEQPGFYSLHPAVQITMVVAFAAIMIAFILGMAGYFDRKR